MILDAFACALDLSVVCETYLMHATFADDLGGDGISHLIFLV